MHEGHRNRMRERFMENGLNDFAPHEVLELLLFYCIPRANTNPIAHDLINTFGSLHGVLEAGPDKLSQVKGVGESTAVFLSMIPQVAKRYQDSLLAQRPVIKNRLDAEQYCRSLFIGLQAEHFYLVGLDTGMRVIGKSLIAKGSLSEVPAYPRQVAEAALALNAKSAIICHNHPGGSPQPSDNDLFITGKLAALLSDIDITLLDHLIVTHSQVLSLSKEGYFTHNDSGAFKMAADASNKLIKNTLRKEESAK